MNLNIKTIIICIGLIIIVYLLMLFKEKFHPNLQVEGNKIDIPSHDINNVDYDNYMEVGDGIEGDVSDNSLPYNKINICEVCKTNKCLGQDCEECASYCGREQEPLPTEATAAPPTTEAIGAPPTTEAIGAPPTTEAIGAPPTTEATGPAPTTEATGAPPTTEATGAPPTTEAIGEEPVSKEKFAIISFKDLFEI